MKTGISLPKTVEFCHKRIKHLEETNEAMSDSMNTLQGKLQDFLQQRDRERTQLCHKCRKVVQ